MRTVARVDANQKEIVQALEQVGASVLYLHQLGKGAPDIAVGLRGITYLFEIKDGAKPPSKRRLTDDEQHWHLFWRGHVEVVVSVDEALRKIGAIQ